MDVQEKKWDQFVVELRTGLNLSQEAFAEKLQTNQCTISRWEQGVTRPSYRMRQKLQSLDKVSPQTSSSVMQEIGPIVQEIFSCGTLPSLLLDSTGTILAVSEGNEYQPGLSYTAGIKLIDQTYPEDMDTILALFDFFEKEKFWDAKNVSYKYHYQSRGIDRCVILTSIQISNNIYCLMQKVII